VLNEYECTADKTGSLVIVHYYSKQRWFVMQLRMNLWKTNIWMCIQHAWTNNSLV